MPLKVLVADKMEQQGLDELAKIADEVQFDATLKGDTLKSRLADFDPDVLIVRSTKVPADIQAAGAGLKLIVRAGSGYDTIDTAAAAARGIRVCNCPGMNAVAVAELVMGLIISLDRKIADNVIDLRAGRWRKKLYSKAGRGLKGRTLGVIGAGRIGAAVARRALAFEMSVVWYDVVPEADLGGLADTPNVARAELDDLLPQADFITLHVPGGEGTHHLIDARRLALMKPEAVLINTSRAGVVDEAALIEAIEAGKLRGAGLDVYADEPPADAESIDSPVCGVAGIYGTHHIGASTEQAQLAVAAEAVRIVAHFKQTGEALHCVNMPAAG